jgi:hypothetical protein
MKGGPSRMATATAFNSLPVGLKAPKRDRGERHYDSSETKETKCGEKILFWKVLKGSHIEGMAQYFFLFLLKKHDLSIFMFRSFVEFKFTYRFCESRR